MDKQPGPETLLVCVGPSPTSLEVIRTSAAIAGSLGARWIAAAVEASRASPLDDAARQQLIRNIRSAERLGAETVGLAGDDIAEEIVRYARSRGVTTIVLGKSREPRWRTLVGRNIVDRVVRLSGDINVFVVHGPTEEAVGPANVRRAGPRAIPWRRYVGALAAVVVASAVALLLQEGGLSEANKAVVFLPAVVLSAMWWGLGAGIVAAVLSVLSFDFFFVPPYLRLAVEDIEYVVTLLVLAAVALLVAHLLPDFVGRWRPHGPGHAASRSCTA